MQQDKKFSTSVSIGGARQSLLGHYFLRASAIITIAIVWCVYRPYGGIVHDARLYVGRALADLHPSTLGQEIAFTHDGQSGFSVFTLPMHFAVEALGASAAAMSVTALGLCLWVGASAYFLSRYVKGAALWASLVALAVLPTGYGGLSIFHIAEPFATPRIFSEAAGIAALGALVRQREAIFFGLLAISAALHPIMAVPIAAVGFVLLVIEDRRWLWAGALAGALFGLAFLLRIPIALRLAEQFDPEWWSIIVARSPHLFPLRWDPKDLYLGLVQILTLILFCLVGDRDLRRISLVAMIVAVGGIALSTLTQSVLLVQLQLWRCQWLVAFLAVAALVPTVIGLKDRGNSERAVIPILLLAWFICTIQAIVLLSYFSILSIILFSKRQNIANIVVTLSWATCSVIALGITLIKIKAYHELLLGVEISEYRYVGLSARLIFELMFLLYIPALGRLNFQTLRHRYASAALLGLCVALAMCFLPRWDSRSEFTRYLERGDGADELRRITVSGSVVWLGGADGRSWFWTGRPEWWSKLQGAPLVFDRTLATEWKARHDSLVRARMIFPASTTRSEYESQPPLLLAESGLRDFCKNPGGPDWIVAPIGLVSGGVDPQHVPEQMRIWHSPASFPVFRRLYKDWVQIRSFGVMACARSSGS